MPDWVIAMLQQAVAASLGGRNPRQSFPTSGAVTGRGLVEHKSQEIWLSLGTIGMIFKSPDGLCNVDEVDVRALQVLLSATARSNSSQAVGHKSVVT
jgi:hypothetical protein